MYGLNLVAYLLGPFYLDYRFKTGFVLGVKAYV